MNNYHELSKLHINIKLIEQFKELESASYPELKQLHNSVLESGLKFELKSYLKNIESVESWIDSSWNKLCTTKVITTLNKRIDVDHLNSKLTINAKLVEKLLHLLYKSEFSLSEDDKYEESSSYLAIKLDQADALQEDDEITPNIIVYAENMSMVPWLNVTSVMNGIMFSVLKMFQIQMLINIFVQRVS